MAMLPSAHCLFGRRPQTPICLIRWIQILVNHCFWFAAAINRDSFEAEQLLTEFHGVGFDPKMFTRHLLFSILSSLFASGWASIYLMIALDENTHLCFRCRCNIQCSICVFFYGNLQWRTLICAQTSTTELYLRRGLYYSTRNCFVSC